MHVLAAGVRRGDPAGLGAGVPVVDGVVVLDAGVGAGPGGLGDLTEERLGVDLLDDLAGHPAAQPELAALLDRGHELVVHTDRVVGVLVLDGRDVVAAQVHVEARVPQDADLLLFLDLGLDEVLDVRVVNVEDDHLGGAAGGTTGLDRSCGGVGAAHEGDRAGGVAAGGEQFLGGADPGEVQAGAGAALEDHALFLVPVEDRLHGVVDGQDEAGGDLLGLLGADVEPDRAVEAEDLVQEGVRQLVLEDLGVGGRGEVLVVLSGLPVRLHDAVDQLLEAGLALRGADGTAEVLAGDDVDRVHRPEVGELDAALLEVDRAVAPVGHDDVTALPRHLVIGVDPRGGVDALDTQTLVRLGALGAGTPCRTARRLCHAASLYGRKRPEVPRCSRGTVFCLVLRALTHIARNRSSHRRRPAGPGAAVRVRPAGQSAAPAGSGTCVVPPDPRSSSWLPATVSSRSPSSASGRPVSSLSSAMAVSKSSSESNAR